MSIERHGVAFLLIFVAVITNTSNARDAFIYKIIPACAGVYLLMG